MPPKAKAKTSGTKKAASPKKKTVTRGPNAFMVFSGEFRAEVMKEHPDWKVRQIERFLLDE